MDLFKKNDKSNVDLQSPLALAYVGDAVYSLFVRQHMVETHNQNTNALTRLTNKYVNAGSQYKIYRKIEPILTSKEQDVCHRARNSNIHSRAKNYTVTEYIYATAFEALLGYLYLTGQQDRLNQILNLSLEEA